LQQVLSAGSVAKANALVRLFVDAAVAQHNSGAIAAFPHLMTRYPQFAGYCGSALTSCANEIDADLRDKLADELQGLLWHSSVRRDDFRIQIARTLGSPGFRRPRALLDFVLRHAERRDSYLVRVAIDGLRTVGTRADLLELMPIYAELGDWAQRAMIKWMVDQGLADRASRLVPDSDDLFARAQLKWNIDLES
jgi:hypothetical protein